METRHTRNEFDARPIRASKQCLHTPKENNMKKRSSRVVATPVKAVEVDRRFPDYTKVSGKAFDGDREVRVTHGGAK